MAIKGDRASKTNQSIDKQITVTINVNKAILTLQKEFLWKKFRNVVVLSSYHDRYLLILTIGEAV